MQNSKLDVFSIETTFINLQDILSNNRLFVIPDYQRGYAWEKDQVDALWNDIAILVKNKSNSSHYMGVLALTKTNKNIIEELGHEGPCFDIIDGQQRITTLMIILIELSKYFPEINNKYIKPNSYIFKLNYAIDGNNKNFLINNIYNDGNDKPKNMYQKNLLSAKENIRNKLLYIDEKEKFLNCVLNKLEFNLYFNPSQFDARKTFETMNYRGKALSNLELLKNKLIFLSTKIAEKETFLINSITRAWEIIYNDLGCNPRQMLQDDEFLKAHWLIYGKSSGNMKEKGDAYAIDILNNFFTEGKYNEETNQYEEIENSFDKIYSYVESLKTCSKFWKCVKFPKLAQNEINMNDTEVNLLDKLSRIRNFSFVNSLILATLYNKDHISSNLRLKLYDLLEKFIFINFCIKSRAKTNDLSFCISCAKNIFNSCDTEYNDNQILKLIDILENSHDKLAIKKRLSEDVLPHIKDEICKNYYYKFNKGLNYFLFEYNRQLQLSVKNTVPLDWIAFKTESIEHILPQKYKKIKSWQLVMKKYQNSDHIERIINNIGNLVGLTTVAKNSSLSNNSYYIKSQIDLSEERQCYKNGTLAEMYIADKYKCWTVKDIYDRAKDLLKFMYDNWFRDYLDTNDFLKGMDDFIGFNVLEAEQEQQALERSLIEIYQDEYKIFTQGKKIAEEKQAKISDIVKTTFKDIITRDDISESKLINLQNRKYCNESFGSLGYPVLKLVDTTRDIAEQCKFETEKNNHNRFYVDPITIKGKKYLLCSQWRDKNLKALLQWINENK